MQNICQRFFGRIEKNTRSEKIMERETYTFMVTDDNGREVECEVLFIFENEETGHDYIVYTDNSCDAYGRARVYASIYDLEGALPILHPITTEEEWKMIESILEELQSELRNSGWTENDTIDTERIVAAAELRLEGKMTASGVSELSENDSTSQNTES